MNESTQKLLYEAQLIIDNHHQGVGELITENAYNLRQQAMEMAGYEDERHDEDAWDEWIPKLPDSIRGTMIELDDCLDCHNTTRFM